MSLNYGTTPSPTQVGIGVLLPLGAAGVGPERPQPGAGSGDSEPDVALPYYLVNGIAGNDDKYWCNAIISVHTLAATIAECDEWAWKAHHQIISLTMGDIIRLPNGETATVSGLGPRTHQMPVYQPYEDPFIKRYYARYFLPLRFSA
ncbi:hypothetical protein MXEN_12026 [Mycobacterium xenopi RIVM700367]|uniref:hypothetical protein n=1 Tax=Mycobacterium xenopi TaxID=1789 RepID=UPI00025AE391|nr:hypothetical protein [Mycobacterium xenopi]EID12934.1 hypothetical protein MXEN_12026 [Mycobacterium xenopi RIVM700367]